VATHSDIFVDKFSSFCKKIIKKNILCFEKYPKKFTKFATISYNMGECLEFSLSYYKYCQIWLNILMDNRNFEHRHKIEKRKKKKNTGGEEGRGPGPKQGVDNEAVAEPGPSF
jgi:hypothetical protein